MGDGGIDYFARNARSAHQFSDDVDFRMRRYFPPVRGFKRRRGCGREFPAIKSPAAESLHSQVKTELERYLVRILQQNSERPRSDVAQPDDPDIDLLHIPYYAGSAASLSE